MGVGGGVGDDNDKMMACKKKVERKDQKISNFAEPGALVWYSGKL